MLNSALRKVSGFGLILALLSFVSAAQADKPYVVYPGGDGPGKGKHIVLVSGDEEYRSEETIPQLGKILSVHHGFKCTVLFAIDPKTGEINPNNTQNIPGLETLKTADLMVIFTRFRNLPDDQMEHIHEYLKSGRPVVGLRTSTHAFKLPKDSKYYMYDWRYPGDDFKRGFGKQVLGETWVAHHGRHGKESSRGIIADDAKDHPILRGIEDGDIWGPTDVYRVNLPLPEGSRPLVLGQVLTGMKPDDPPVKGKKNDPMMPVAWTKTYQVGDTTGRVFTTTMGASQDFESEGMRRLLVNGCYWALGMEEQIPKESKAEIVGEFETRPFKFGGFKKGLKPSDHELK